MKTLVKETSSGKIALLEVSGDERTIVNAARVSFGNRTDLLTKKDKELLKYLWINRHTSPFEKVTFLFYVSCPLPISKQWMRHRTWCLSGDTEITINRPDKWKQGYHCAQSRNSGEPFTIKYLYECFHSKYEHVRKRTRNLLIRVWDEKNKVFTCSTIDDVIFSGIKECFKITLEDGKTLTCSKDHLLLTSEGWQTLEHAVNLELTKNKVATMAKEAFILTNGTTQLWTSYEWLKAQREKNLSIQEIANLAGCSYYTIRKWLKKLGLNYIQTHCHLNVHHNKEMARSKKGTPLTGEYKKIIKIEYIGNIETYDLSIKGEHKNFVANGMVVHNSYNELSRRYTSKSISFYIPERFRLESKHNKQASCDAYLDSTKNSELVAGATAICDICEKFYNELLENGVAKEQARLFLPTALMTEFYAKVDLKNLLDFVTLRATPDAQFEMAEFAYAIKDMIKEVLPDVYKIYTSGKFVWVPEE